MSHAKLSPSGALRWMNCPGSVRLEADLPDSTSIYAEEGTVAHSLLEDFIKKEGFKVLPDEISQNEHYGPEMLENILAVYDYICGIEKEVLYSETRVDLDPWIDSSFGTCDVIAINGKHLHIMDLKYGRGVPVEATNNPQLQLYALGAYNILNSVFGFEKVTLHIMQPRLGNYSSHNITTKQLLKFGDKVRKAAKATEKEDAATKAGEWCKFCKARAFCQTRADYNLQLVNEAKNPVGVVSPDKIAEYLKFGEEVANWLSDLKAYALDKCLAGETITGLKAVEGKSTRVFTDFDAAFKHLKDLGYDDAVLYERKPLTLAQLEKAIGAGKFAAEMAAFIDKPKGKPTLVPESDKRPAITSQPAVNEMFTVED